MVLSAHPGSTYRQALTDLRQVILEMGGCAEECLLAATDALLLRDRTRRDRCLALEVEIDALEVEIDERCMKILALHQPAASELRFVAMAMKIATDLERIGDLATNIAKRGTDLVEDDRFTAPPELEKMSAAVRRMITSALDSFVQRSVALAEDVLAADDEVDAYHWSIYRATEAQLSRAGADVGALLKVVSLTRDLERAADHATNIAEGVIFMVQGRASATGAAD